jgi:hypothetical protein
MPCAAAAAGNPSSAKPIQAVSRQQHEIMSISPRQAVRDSARFRLSREKVTKLGAGRMIPKKSLMSGRDHARNQGLERAVQCDAKWWRASGSINRVRTRTHRRRCGLGGGNRARLKLIALYSLPQLSLAFRQRLRNH